MEKNDKDLNKQLMAFIDKTPTAFNCVANVRELLIKNGFNELLEQDDWRFQKGSKFFVIRNDSSIIAFKINDPKNSKWL